MNEEHNRVTISFHQNINEISFIKSPYSSSLSDSRSVLHCTEQMIENLDAHELNQIKERCRLELSYLGNWNGGSPVASHWASPEMQELIKRMHYFPDNELNSLMIHLMLRQPSFRQIVTATIVVFLSVESFKTYYLPNQIMDDARRSKSSRLPHPWYKLFHLFWQQFPLNAEQLSTLKKVINESCYKLQFVPPGKWSGKCLKAWTREHRQMNASAMLPNTSRGSNHLYDGYDDEDEDDDDEEILDSSLNQDLSTEPDEMTSEVEELSDEDYIPPNISQPPLDEVMRPKKRPSDTLETFNANKPFNPIKERQVLYKENRCDLSPQELADLKERLTLELSFRHDENETNHWASNSPGIMNRIRKLDFFPSPELNLQMTKLLLKIKSHRSIVFSTMVVFYGTQSFKTYYLPCQIELTKNNTALKPPFPKYKTYHYFWQRIHGNEAPPTRFKRLIMSGNYLLRRIPNSIGWKGKLTNKLTSSKPSSKHSSSHSKKSSLVHKFKHRPLIRSQGTSSSSFSSSLSSSVPKLIPLDSSNQTADNNFSSHSSNGINGSYSVPPLAPLNRSASDLASVNDEFLRDEKGNAFVFGKNGKRLYTYIDSLITISYDEFFKASRLICMKARIYSILQRVAPHALKRDLIEMATPMKYAPEAKKRILNLSYFPDHTLNDLTKRLLFSEHSICKQVKWSASIFWSEEELNTSAWIPSIMPFSRIHHEPLYGYVYFHQLWNYVLGVSNSEDRRRTLRSAITEIYREK